MLLIIISILFALVRAVMPETTALGAAIAAGRAEGVDCLQARKKEEETARDIFTPKSSKEGKIFMDHKNVLCCLNSRKVM